MQEHDVAGEPAKVLECNMTPTLSGSGFLQQFGECRPVIDTDISIEELWSNFACPRANGRYY